MSTTRSAFLNPVVNPNPTARTTWTTRTPRIPRAMRLLLGTAVIALAGGLSQAVVAAPAEGHGGHGGPGMGMGAGMGTGMGMGLFDGRHAERMLDSVNATPDQRTQIKQIVVAARTDMAAQRDASRKLHEQSQSAFAQPNVDARAVETLRQQMLAQHDQASKRMTQLMLDVSRVLTPEQRKTLSDRLTQRRAMMERHQAERSTLERAPR